MAEKKTTKKTGTTTKKTTTKNTTKKVTPKATVNKSTVHHEVKKSKKFDSTKLLTVVFCILLVVVIVLTIVVIKKKHDNKDAIKANIVIPIVNKVDESAFNINVPELNKKGQYIFRIANYNDKEVNNEDLTYTIDIKNNSDSKISVTKSDSTNNLMVDQNNTIIVGGQVKKAEKDSSYYIVKITEPGKLGKKELISIRITVSKK